MYSKYLVAASDMRVKRQPSKALFFFVLTLASDWGRRAAPRRDDIFVCSECLLTDKAGPCMTNVTAIYVCIESNESDNGR